MSKYGFFGGVHPEYHKELSSGKAIETMPVPEKLIVYFSQNIGAAPKPVVKKGDEVKKGQVIAEASGFVSVPVHAPTSGKIEKIDIFPHPAGSDLPAAVIASDGEDEWLEGLNVEQDTDTLNAEQIKELIRDAGLVGMGGATFPTHVKLSPPEGKNIDLLILNGAECEPLLHIDQQLMNKKAETIVKGLKLAMQSTGARKGIIALKEKYKD